MTPFRVLELIPRLLTFPFDWALDTGDLYPAFKTLCLQPSSYVPESFPCPRDCGCWHRIIRRHDGTGAIAACACDPVPNCPDLVLTIEDITPLEVNVPRLGRALCRALDLDSKPSELAPPNTTQIGSWSADAIPVILTIQAARTVFHNAVAELVARIRRPFILISPTAKHMTVATQEILTSAQAALVTMESAVILTPSATLLPTKPPGELFAQFTPQPKDLDEDAARRAFALIQQLESESALPPPTTLAVFRLCCIEALSAAEAAARCGCSKATIINRLALIRQNTGLDPARFRTLSSHFAKIEADLSDPRARHIHRQSAIDEDTEDED